MSSAAAEQTRATGEALPPHSLAGVMDAPALRPVVVKYGPNNPAVRELLGPPSPEALEAAKDRPTRRDVRLGMRMGLAEVLRDMLGTVAREVTVLQRCDGELIGEHRDLGGRIVRWSLWAPAAGILVDREKPRPSDEELARRLEFAQRIGARYAYVEPGAKVSPAEIRHWLEEIKEAGA